MGARKPRPTAPVPVKSSGQPLVCLPRNDAQRSAEKLFPTTDWMFLMGVAGTGKTHQAVKMALDALLGRVKLPFPVRKIMITRPTVEAGPKQGFLPGGPDDKMGPWMRPIGDVLHNLTSTKAEEVMKSFEICPFQYMRGRTFEDCIVIVDECQNCSFDLLELAYTRLGTRGKMIFCGSATQSDLPADQRDLEYFVDSLHGSPGVGVVYFDETMIMRNPRIAAGLKALAAGRSRMEADRAKTTAKRRRTA